MSSCTRPHVKFESLVRQSDLMRAFRLRLKGPPNLRPTLQKVIVFENRNFCSTRLGDSPDMHIMPNVFARQKACQPTEVCYRKWTLHGTNTQ
ncbi:hypothetical protein GQ600_1580 [Phytophthora cactorum]|nr:hypothetical protein GQ600_1580 [Phytophthora cactorum]